MILTKTLKFIWKFVYRTLIGLSVLLVLLLLIIRTEWAQEIITNKATSWLSEKTGTVISVDRLFLNFSGALTIEGLYVEDIHQDTLLYSRKLEAGFKILPLFQGVYHITNIEWNGVVANVERSLPDSSFNFDFIIYAFSSQQGTPADVAQAERSAFREIKLGSLLIADFRLRYADAVAGISSTINLGMLELETRSLDFEKLDFRLKHLSFLNSSVSVVVSNSPPSNDSVSVSPVPFISIDECLIQQISFLFNSPDDSMLTHVEIGKVNMNSLVADLRQSEILLRSLSISGSKLVQQLPIRAQASPRDTLPVKEDIWPKWNVRANQIRSIHNSIQIDQGSAAFVERTFNPNHLKLDSLSFSMKDVYLENKSAGINLESLSFQEQCGFKISESKFQARLSDQLIQIDSFLVTTQHSRFATAVKLRYASLENFVQKPLETVFDVDVSPSVFSGKDLVCFSPEMMKTSQMAAFIRHPVKLSGHLQGVAKSTTVSALNLSWGARTQVFASGTLKGLPAIDKLEINFPDIKLNSGKEDIVQFFPEDDFPVELPSSFSADADVSGSLSKLSASAVILSTDGRLDLEGSYSSRAKQMHYSVYLEPKLLSIGKILRQQDVGKLSGQIAISGEGLDLNMLDATLAANIQSLDVNHYTYRNITIGAEAIQGFATAELAYSDSNLIATLHATGNLDTLQPAYSLDLNLEGANLKALGLTSEDIRTKMNLSADFSGTLKEFTSTAEISNGLIIKNEKRYPLDSVLFKFSGNRDSTRMRIKTPFVNGMADGNASPSLIVDAISKHLRHYFTTGKSAIDSSGTIVFKAEIDLKQTPIITEVLIPKLVRFKPAQLEIAFNEKKQALNVDLDLAMLDYDATRIDSLELHLTSNPDTLGLVLNYAGLKSGIVDMYQTNFGASVSRDSVYLTLVVRDSVQQKLFQLASEVYTPGTEYLIHFDPEALILNGESWQIPASNLIRLGTNSLEVIDFEWKKGNQELHAQTPSGRLDELSIQFDKFEIRNVTSMINPKKIPIQGEIQGELILKDLFGNFGFTSNLKIDSVEVIGNELGVLQFKAASRGQEKYDLDASLAGEGIDLALKGHYSAALDAQDTHIELLINKLNISKIEEFSNNAIRKGKGSLSGKLIMNGAIAKPNYTGKLQFHDAAFDVAAFNGQYELSDELITVANKQVVFDRLRIKDRAGNVSRISGKIDVEDLLNPAFDLNLLAEGFTLLNSSKSDNNLFFGKAIVNADVSIKGSLQSPVITAFTALTSQSELTFIVPESQVELIDRNGVVQFVNVANISSPLSKTDVDGNMNGILGIDLSTKLKVDPSVVLKLIIDERSGDYLEVSGMADLEFLMDPSGRVSLSGIYELRRGKYKLSLFGVVKKEFDLQAGSRISWAGDPLDAKLDLTAIYRVKTSSGDLMADLLTGADASVKNRYRQVLPFDVMLKLKGNLLKPEITFRIDLPEKDRNALGGNVYAKLLQLNENESELNKQVFSLLVLNSFVPSGASGGNFSAEAATSKFARSSVSQLLSDQINGLSGKYIKGVNVGVDLSSYRDYQTGSAEDRTQLNLNVKKELFSSRLNIQVGSQFDLEGSAAKNQNASTDFLGDLTVEYLITEDGRYKLKGFRRNSYEGAIDGQLILTGGSVSFNRNFNTFNELFKKDIDFDPKNEHKK